jgi:hypothetical protein
MRTALHILTRPDDPTARAVVEAQQQDPDLKVEVADLTVPRPDYDALVEAIFQADSVAVW